MIDSHCHLNLLDLTPFDNGLTDVIAHAIAEGVTHLLTVSVCQEDADALSEIVSQYPGVSMSVGAHPNEKDSPMGYDALCEQAARDKVVAIGETGLDYYRSTGELTWQQTHFAEHIAAARTKKLPLIIHSRAAKEDTLSMLKSHQASDVGGVLHCFTEDWEMAKKGIDLGFLISLSGIVTFKNATDLQEVARKLPLDAMLIETDAPYLAPTPMRGKSNLPGYVRYVAEFLATLKGVSLDTLVRATDDNFSRVFLNSQKPIRLACTESS